MAFSLVGSSTNGRSLRPAERLATFLYSMRSNNFNYFAGHANDLDESTVAKNTTVVVNALNPRVPGFLGDRPSFVQRHIYIPGREKSLEDARNFGLSSGFPEIVWALVDGTHIEVSSSFQSLPISNLVQVLKQ